MRMVGRICTLDPHWRCFEGRSRWRSFAWERTSPERAWKVKSHMLLVVPSLCLTRTGEDVRAQLPSPATVAAYKYASLPGWTLSSGAMHTKPSSISQFCSWGFTITATENNNRKAWDTILLVPDRQGQTQHTAFSLNIRVDSLDLSTGNLCSECIKLKWKVQS